MQKKRLISKKLKNLLKFQKGFRSMKLSEVVGKRFRRKKLEIKRLVGAMQGN